MNRPLFSCGLFTFVYRLSEDIEKPSECLLSDGNFDSVTGSINIHILCEAVARSEENATHRSLARMLRDFHHKASAV